MGLSDRFYVFLQESGLSIFAWDHPKQTAVFNFISNLVLRCQSKMFYVTSVAVSEYDGKLSE